MVALEVAEVIEVAATEVEAELVTEIDPGVRSKGVVLFTPLNETIPPTPLFVEVGSANV